MLIVCLCLLPGIWDREWHHHTHKRGEREEEEEALGLDDFVCRVAPCSPLLLLLLENEM